MPTSTVKHVSARLGPRKIESRRLNENAFLNRFSKRKVSKFTWPATLFATCALLCLTARASVNAQTLRARISVTSVAPARIRIDAEFPGATNVLSFRNAYGGVLGLGERIEMVAARNADGGNVVVQKLAPGEFQAAEKFTRLTYGVNLSEPSRPAQMSHVSWLNRDQGLLMLADLLPQPTMDSGNFSSASIQLDVPTSWSITSNITNEGNQQYWTDNPDKALFLTGPSLREKSQRLGAVNFSIITSGKWPFSDADATEITRKIIEEYSKVTGFELKRYAFLMLIPFPGEAGPESWTAETRANDVLLLLGRKASRKKVLARLGIVLSHELFHLWVPNSLKLNGDYDWFFEGFTLYQALRTDLRLGLISFDDYLATIARVYDSYLSAVDHDRLSLIEASERRWTTSPSLVYEKGMLVAFIYDLTLRSLSDCKASLDDVYKQLFRRQSTGHGNANETIIKVLSEHAGLESFAKDYVQGAVGIKLESVLSPHGFQVQRGVGGTKIVVGRDLNKGQQKLLGCIGYRN